MTFNLELTKKMINLTPHPIMVAIGPPGLESWLEIAPSGRRLIVKGSSDPVDDYAGIPTVLKTTNGVQGIAEELENAPEGSSFIVSGLVLKTLKEAGVRRDDIFSPGTAPEDNPIRGEDGNIVAVRLFHRLWFPYK